MAHKPRVKGAYKKKPSIEARIIGKTTFEKLKILPKTYLPHKNNNTRHLHDINNKRDENFNQSTVIKPLQLSP